MESVREIGRKGKSQNVNITSFVHFAFTYSVHKWRSKSIDEPSATDLQMLKLGATESRTFRPRDVSPPGPWPGPRLSAAEEPSLRAKSNDLP